MVKYFNDTWMSSKIPEWYKVMILSTQLSGIAKTADSILGAVLSLNSNESGNKYLSAEVSVLLTTGLEHGNLFCIKCKYT